MFTSNPFSNILFNCVNVANYNTSIIAGVSKYIRVSVDSRELWELNEKR